VESAIGLVILVAWIYVAFLSSSLSFFFCNNVHNMHNVFYRKKVSLPTNLASFHNKAHSEYTVRFAPSFSSCLAWSNQTNSKCNFLPKVEVHSTRLEIESALKKKISHVICDIFTNVMSLKYYYMGGGLFAPRMNQRKCKKGDYLRP
jgi:hypothetical protein